jgi:7tm Chemosensory receptor
MSSNKFQEELNSSLIVFEVFGMQFFSLKKLYQERANVRPTIWRIIYVVVAIITLAILMTIGVTQLEEVLVEAEEKVNAKNVLLITITHSAEFAIVLNILICIIQSYRSTREMKNLFFNSIKLIETASDEFHVNIDIQRIKVLALKRFAATATFFAVSHGLLVFSHKDSGLLLFVFFAATPPVLFLFLIAYKFIYFVVMINEQLQFLDFLLDNFFNQDQIQPLEIYVTKFKKVKPVKTLENRATKLQAGRRIFNLIQENSEIVNRSHGMEVLIYMNIMVTFLILKTYELFTIFVGTVSSQKTPEAVYFNCITTVIIVTTIYYCQQTQNLVSFFEMPEPFLTQLCCFLQMEKLASTIVRMQVNHQDELTFEMREALQSFYCQVTMQPIEFSAYGFFTLNLALLASITTGILSYLIILVQFYAS